MPISISHRWSWRLGVRCAVAVVAIVGSPVPGWSNAMDLSGMFADKLGAINEAVQFGQWETYATGHAWHLPYGYDDATRARLNETAWGGGFGRTVEDENGDRHSVYFMAFSDSHRAPQLNLGYAWQRYWPATRNLSVGAGYLAFFFSRDDVANHLPMPALLPCASIRYRRFEIVGLFVPRVSRHIKGDVLFVYLRVPLGDVRVRNVKNAASLDRSSRRRP